MIENVVDSKSSACNINVIREKLMTKHGYDLTRSRIERLLKKDMGYVWKAVKLNQPYVNAPRNIYSRYIFAKQLITAVLNGRKVINFDESGFTDSYPDRKGWIKRGKSFTSTTLRKWSNITLLSAITQDGEHWFSLLRGTNTTVTFVDYLRMLVQELDVFDKYWRDSYVLVLDNASMHKSRAAINFFAELKISHLYTGVASYNALPVETLFSIVK